MFGRKKKFKIFYPVIEDYTVNFKEIPERKNKRGRKPTKFKEFNEIRQRPKLKMGGNFSPKAYTNLDLLLRSLVKKLSEHNSTLTECTNHNLALFSGLLESPEAYENIISDSPLVLVEHYSLQVGGELNGAGGVHFSLIINAERNDGRPCLKTNSEVFLNEVTDRKIPIIYTQGWHSGKEIAPPPQIKIAIEVLNGWLHFLY